METLAKSLATKLANELGFDCEKRDVIAYGLTALIQVIITTTMVFLLGLMFGVVCESLVICFSVSLLRKYSGGAHLGTIEVCTLFAVVYSVGIGAISKYILAPIIGLELLVIISIVIYFISFFFLYKLSPVDSPNKPIKTQNKKNKMRKGSFITLFVYALVSCVLFIFMDHFFTITIQISLIFGISWQVFTLTKLGFLFIKSMNTVLTCKSIKGKEAS